jgi:hypothetical protein
VRVQFHCKRCGAVVTDVDCANLKEIEAEYRCADKPSCPRCKPTVVYSDTVRVEHRPGSGPYTDVAFSTSAKKPQHYFSIGADTMDAICEAWLEYRGDDA